MSNETSAADPVANAREAVRDAVRRLEPIRADLLKLVEGLPLPPSSQNQKDLDTLSGLTELDAVIRCVLHDHLEPLLVSLRETYESRAPPQGSRAPSRASWV